MRILLFAQGPIFKLQIRSSKAVNEAKHLCVFNVL